MTEDQKDAARWRYVRDHLNAVWTVPQVFSPFTLRIEIPF